MFFIMKSTCETLLASIDSKRTFQAIHYRYLLGYVYIVMSKTPPLSDFEKHFHMQC